MVFPAEGRVALHIRTEAAIGPAQQRQTRQIERPIIYESRIDGFLHVLKFVLPQQTLLPQQIQINKIRVAREGGEGLIRAVAIACRSQRQYLPIGLPG